MIFSAGRYNSKKEAISKDKITTIEQYWCWRRVISLILLVTFTSTSLSPTLAFGVQDVKNKDRAITEFNKIDTVNSESKIKSKTSKSEKIVSIGNERPVVKPKIGNYENKKRYSKANNDSLEIFPKHNKYQPYFELGGAKHINQRSNAAGIYDLFIPLLQTDEQLLFTDLRIFDRSGSSSEGNLHLGYRKLYPSSNQIFGVYGAFDLKRSDYGNRYNQIMLGMEYWQNKWFIGANIYKPLGTTKSLFKYEISPIDTPTNRGISITKHYEKALAGTDAEIGCAITDNLTWYAGGYYFHADDAGTIAGPKTRVTYNYNQPNGRILGVLDGVSIEAGVQHDKERKINAYIGIKFKVGLTNLDKNSNLFGFERHMTELVRRDPDVIIGQAQETKEKFYQPGENGFQEGKRPGDEDAGENKSSKNDNKDSRENGNGNDNKENPKEDFSTWTLEELLKELSLPQGVTKKEVNKRYRKLAHKYHPDKEQDPTKKKEATKNFIRISDLKEAILIALDKGFVNKNPQDPFSASFNRTTRASTFEANFSQTHSQAATTTNETCPLSKDPVDQNNKLPGSSFLVITGYDSNQVPTKPKQKIKNTENNIGNFITTKTSINSSAIAPSDPKMIAATFLTNISPRALFTEKPLAAKSTADNKTIKLKNAPFVSEPYNLSNYRSGFSPFSQYDEGKDTLFPPSFNTAKAPESGTAVAIFSIRPDVILNKIYPTCKASSVRKTHIEPLPLTIKSNINNIQKSAEGIGLAANANSTSPVESFTPALKDPLLFNYSLLVNSTDFTDILQSFIFNNVTIVRANRSFTIDAQPKLSKNAALDLEKTRSSRKGKSYHPENLPINGSINGNFTVVKKNGTSDYPPKEISKEFLAKMEFLLDLDRLDNDIDSFILWYFGQGGIGDRGPPPANQTQKLVVALKEGEPNELSRTLKFNVSALSKKQEAKDTSLFGSIVKLANDIVDKIFRIFIPIPGVRAQTVEQPETTKKEEASAPNAESIYNNRLSLIREQLLVNSPRLDSHEIEETEADLRSLFQYFGTLPLDIVNLIFSRYEKDQSFFTQLVVDLLAEEKNLPPATLKKLIKPLTSISDIKIALFIGLRLEQQGVQLPDNVLKYFVSFLADANKATVLRATEFFYYIAQTSPQRLPSTTSDLIINLLPNVSSNNYRKLNTILGNLRLTKEQEARVAIQKEIANWHQGLVTIEDKQQVGEGLITYVNTHTAKDLLVFVQSLILLQQKGFYEIVDALSKEVEKYLKIGIRGREKELLDKLSPNNRSSDQCSLVYSCFPVEGGKLLLTSEQRKKLQDVFKKNPWLEEVLTKLEFIDYKSLERFINFVTTYKLTKPKTQQILNKLARDPPILPLKVYLEFLLALTSDIAIKSSLTVNEQTLLQKQLTYLVNDLKWPVDRLYRLFTKLEPKDLVEFISLGELLRNYKIDSELLNRNSEQAIDILEKHLLMEPEESSILGTLGEYVTTIFNQVTGKKHLSPLALAAEDIYNLIRDNRFFTNKRDSALIKDLENNPIIKKLLTDDYFAEKLTQIKQVERELAQPKFQVIIQKTKPKSYQANTIYAYKEQVTTTIGNEKKEQTQFCLASSPAAKLCTKDTELSSERIKSWENILANDSLANKTFLCLEAVKVGIVTRARRRCLSFGEWQRQDYQEWRDSIKEVTEDNIAEIAAVFSEIVHKTILDNKHYPRTVQKLAVLALWKLPQGGLAQIATGEGKSLIVAIFAALNVLSGKKVDIVTSSKVLAIRDAENPYYQAFYNVLGISVSHNISDRAGPKACYNSDVVYGDLTHFIGDMLKDITANVKLGRGNELVIVDEVDNMFIDELRMLVQLAWPMPGFEFLNQVFVYMWGTAANNLKFLTPGKNGECYLNVPVGKNSTLDDMIKEIDLEQLENIRADEYSFKVKDNCADFLRETMGNFTTQNIFSFEHKRSLRNVVVPSHLEEHAKQQLIPWLDSLIDSYSMKDKSDYITYVDTNNILAKNSTIVAPVDYSNTGVIQTNLHWSNGLHQFLQIANRITLHPESVISIFMSYVEFFNKYRGNIFGVTGTLGARPHQEFLNKVYGVETLSIPSFAYKDFVEFTPILAPSKKLWLQNITEVVWRTIKEARAGLIVFELIQEVEELRDLIISQGYPKDQIFTYGIGGIDEEQLFKRYLKPGDIVIATNLAGRGADIQINREVIRHGGLHVIATNFSKSLRVLEQCYGRCARKGEPGSAQLIIHLDPKNPCKDIACLKDQRDETERRLLLRNFLVTLPAINIRDQLFNDYIGFMRQINSTTDYQIKLGTPTNESYTIYLYQNPQGIFFTVNASGQEAKKDINITHEIKLVASGLFARLKHILSRSDATLSELNKFDHEALLFIAALHGYVTNTLFYTAVTSDWVNLVSGTWSNYDLGRLDYFATLGLGKKFTEALAQGGAYEKKFLMWLINREQYGHKEEVKQLDEVWGIWLQTQEKVFHELNLLDNEKNSLTELKNKQQRLQNKLKQEFGEFKKRELLKFNQNSLLRNPAYLVEKAERYFTLRYFYPKESKLIDNILDEALGFLNKALELDAHYSWAAQTIKSQIHLYREGRKLKDLDEAEEAYNVKKKFYDSTQAAMQNIKEVYTAVYENQLAYLLSNRFLNFEDELAVQLIGGQAIYQKILEAHQNNLNLIASLKENKMIELADYTQIADLAKQVNITEAVNRMFHFTSNSTAIEFNNRDLVVEQITAAGVHSIPQLTTYTLEDNRSYFGNFFGIVLGIASIFTGCWMLGAFHSVFATAFAGSLIFGGVGDILTSAYAWIKGQPIDIKDYLKSKALSLAIAIGTAGTLQLFSQIPAIGSRLGSALSKLSELRNHIGMVFAIQATTMAVTGLLYEMGRKFIDPEELKKEAQQKITDIIKLCKEKLRRIFASDFFNNDTTLIGKLYKKLAAIINKYAERFKSTGEQLGRGVATGTASHLLTGLPILGNVIDAGVNVVTNSIKNSEALDDIADGTMAAILEVNSESLATGKMLAINLEKDFGKEVAGELITALKEQQYLLGGELDYQDCAKLEKLNLKSELAGYKVGVIEECGYIQAIMTHEYEQEYKILSERFVDLVVNLKTGIQKEIVESAATMPGGLLGQYFGEKIYEYAINRLNILQGKGKQDKAKTQETTKGKDNAGYKGEGTTKKNANSARPNKGKGYDVDSLVNEPEFTNVYNELPTEYKKEIDANIKLANELKQEAAKNTLSHEKKFLEGKLQAVAIKAEEYLNKYHALAAEHPVLASSMLLSSIILAKGLTGAAIGGTVAGVAGIAPGLLGGLAKAVRDEAWSMSINLIAGQGIEQFVTSAIDKYSPSLIKLDPTLTPEQASMLASILLAGALSSQEFLAFAKAFRGVDFSKARIVNGKVEGGNYFSKATKDSYASGESIARSINQMKQQVSRGQAPKSIDRVDSGSINRKEKPHVHFNDNSALNSDGTWKHGGKRLTNEEKRWLNRWGWKLPNE